MEDISRKLEREIAQAKPSSYKQKRKKRILIVDDFGEMKSGGYLKVLVYIFLVVSIICFSGASGLYYFFSRLILENQQLTLKVTRLEKKTDHLIDENEVLMARLVISGKELKIKTRPSLHEKSLTSTMSETKEKISKIKEKSGVKDMAGVGGGLSISEADPVSTGLVPVGNNDPSRENQILEKDQVPIKATVSAKHTISIEKFSLIRGRRDSHLELRFDIRNLSNKPGNIAGHIFAILKPENKPQDQWLVVPSSPLQQGVPSQYKNGQYFSIAHFKPVTFKINNQAEPNLLKTAAIYIFNEDGNLICENLFDITKAESH